MSPTDNDVTASHVYLSVPWAVVLPDNALVYRNERWVTLIREWKVTDGGGVAPGDGVAACSALVLVDTELDQDLHDVV